MLPSPLPRRLIGTTTSAGLCEATAHRTRPTRSRLPDCPSQYSWLVVAVGGDAAQVFLDAFEAGVDVVHPIRQWAHDGKDLLGGVEDGLQLGMGMGTGRLAHANSSLGLTPSAAASLRRVDGCTLVSPCSRRLMVPWVTPEASASSRWDRAASMRSLRRLGTVGMTVVTIVDDTPDATSRFNLMPTIIAD